MTSSDINGSTQINDNCDSFKNEEKNDSPLKNYINIFSFSNIHPKTSITLTKLNCFNIPLRNYCYSKIESVFGNNKLSIIKNSPNINFTKDILKKLSFEMPSKAFLKDENSAKEFLNHYNDSFSNFCGVNKNVYCDVFVNNDFETSMNDLGEINILVKCIIDEIKKIPKGIHSKKTKKQRKFKKLFRIRSKKYKRKALIFRVVAGEKKPVSSIELNEEKSLNKEKTINSFIKNKVFGLNLKKKLTLKIPEKKNVIHFAEPISNQNKEIDKPTCDLSNNKNGIFSFNQTLKKIDSEKNNNGNIRDFSISPNISLKINSTKPTCNTNNYSYKNLNLFKNNNFIPFTNNYPTTFPSQSNNVFNFSRNITQNYLDAVEQKKKNELLNKKRTPLPPSIFDNNIYNNNSPSSIKQSLSPLYIGTHSAYLSPYIIPGSNIQSPLFFNLNSPYSPSNLFRDDNNLFSCSSYNFSGFNFDRSFPKSPNSSINANNGANLNNSINSNNNINTNNNVINPNNINMNNNNINNRGQSLFDFLYKNNK